ncbi:MAG: D-alanyl-D-alanine carboxypeptidase family protein, partial [Clostridia bacterium]|nr:D-alanyl-D-alanine carboxypeptidase family protein [Clostridia bacterium]
AWIKENGAKYGIVLRYPAEKVEITGFIYEAWHFRYVGKDAARVLNARGITLEEYVAAKYGLFHRESRVTVKSGSYNSITQFSRETGYIQLTGRHFLDIGEGVRIAHTQKESTEC